MACRSMNTPGKPTATRGWDTYWKGTCDSDSYAAGGTRHPVIKAFWDEALGRILMPTDGDIRVLDIATGSGAVVESLSRVAADRDFDITCVDISEAAIESVGERFPAVTGIVADARSIPLEDRSYHLVTSQFGAEYAGMGALDEAARLLAPGGNLIMLVHIRPGIIFNECRASLDAVRRTQRAEFVEHALRFFEAGFAAVRGADRTAYDKAGLGLNRAIRELESILDKHGEEVAGGTIARLYADIERIHSRIQHYEPDEVTDWLRIMADRLAAYAERMASMCKSAVDKKSFREICARMEKQGLTLVRGKPLAPSGGSLPIAWIVHAVRGD